MNNKNLRPDPVTTQDSLFFWQALERGELQAQQCQGCQHFMHPPRPMCPKCNSLDIKPHKLSGKGRVYSWCLPQHPRLPVFEYPLVVALIELEEGIRLLSNVVECDIDTITSNMPVEVCFAPTVGGKTIHQFKPRNKLETQQ